MRLRSRTFVFGMLSLMVLLSACAGSHGPQVAWDPPPYFAEEHFVEIDGINVCYVEAGQDNEQVIVFVHGWSGDLQNWWDQYEYFKDEYHVLIMDHPGHGKSERERSIEYGIPLFARTVIGLMDERGIEQAILVGNSMGGHISAYIAIHYPERVDKLVLSDSAGSSRVLPMGLMLPVANRHTVKSVRNMMGEQYPGDDPKALARNAVVQSREGTDQEGPYARALSMSIKSIVKESLRKELDAIRAPTLLIWGDDDPLVSVKAIDTFEDRIRETQTYLVPKGGHTPNMDKPEEFNCAVDAFIKGESLEDCKR